MKRLGFDLGGTNMVVGIVDEEGRVISKLSCPTRARRSQDAIAADMANLVHELLVKNELTPADVSFLGVASPGIANSDTGVIEYANNLPFENFAVADYMREKTGIANVSIGNDANAAALGEAVCGQAKGTKNSVMITLGTGVGGGIILNGKIHTGINHSAGELGHIVIHHGGRKCTCGRRGCWETYSSAVGLIEMTREKMRERTDSAMWRLCDGDSKRLSGKTAFAASRLGDEAACEVVGTYVEYLACGLTNIINIFQPEVLSIGGGISGEGEYLLEPLRRIVDFEQYSSSCPVKTRLCIATAGNDAGIIGAAFFQTGV
ncbi:MAG: ROK family protein [Clostridia bacterium]|nr:ROK family protein [Clostridia bacterium]